MIAIRTLFATLMTVMVANSLAQSSSSSSGPGVVGSSSSGMLSSSSPAVVMSSSSTAAAMSSSSPVVSGSSSTGLMDSSSSAPLIPPPMWNDSSSSSSGWFMSSSSSTGSETNNWFYPAGTYEVTYWIELIDGTIRPGLSDALLQDFASTVAAEPMYNTTAESIRRYLRVAIAQPAMNTTNFTVPIVGVPMNTTVTTIILGNITQVVVLGGDSDVQSLAQTFAIAAQNGSTIKTQTVNYGVNIYPQEVLIVQSPYTEENMNGASSTASASLLVASMIAALALAF